VTLRQREVLKKQLGNNTEKEAIEENQKYEKRDATATMSNERDAVHWRWKKADDGRIVQKESNWTAAPKSKRGTVVSW
jgi:hypothetical protein